jgi:hypothetical protein
MDLGKAFSYTFDDPDWIKKVLIGGAIGLVPILNFAVYGYTVEVIQRVINGDPGSLPEWDDIGGKFVKGLMYFVIAFVYALPLILVGCLFGVGTSVLGGGAASSRGSSDTMGGLISILSLCFSCVAILYGLFIGVVLPAAIGNYAAKNQLSAAFRFGDVFSLVQKNLGLFLMVLVISIAAGFVAGVVGSIACVVGSIFTLFWYQLVMGHAMGQAYRTASTNIGLV